MATLTETSYYTRKGAKIFAGAIIGVVVLRILLNIGGQIWQALFPPPPPPATMAFGLLPKPKFPQTDIFSALPIWSRGFADIVKYRRTDLAGLVPPSASTRNHGFRTVAETKISANRHFFSSSDLESWFCGYC